MNVLVIKYFPLTADRKNIDSSIAGFDSTFEQARQKTIDITNNLVTLLAKASTYLGYNDSSGKQCAALQYRYGHTKLEIRPIRVWSLMNQKCQDRLET